MNFGYIWDLAKTAISNIADDISLLTLVTKMFVVSLIFVGVYFAPVTTIVLLLIAVSTEAYLINHKRFANDEAMKDKTAPEEVSEDVEVEVQPEQDKK